MWQLNRKPKESIQFQRNYSEELALMYLYNDDFDRSRHYAACAVETFLQDWSSMDSLQETSRANTLQKLQGLTELQELLTFLSCEGEYFGNAFFMTWPITYNLQRHSWTRLIVRVKAKFVY